MVMKYFVLNNDKLFYQDAQFYITIYCHKFIIKYIFMHYICLFKVDLLVTLILTLCVFIDILKNNL